MTGVQTCALPICFPVTIPGGIVSDLVNLFNEFDKRAVAVGRNFRTTPENARKTAEEFKRISATSGNILSTTSNLTESFNDLNAVAGTYANFSQETLETYNDLTKGLGLSKEATLAQYKISVLQGKNLKDFSSQITGQISLQKSQNKIALSDKEIMGSIVWSDSGILSSGMFLPPMCCS